MPVVSDILLRGCTSIPLACYLKALGILRLVAEQRDSTARGFWNGECFQLRTRLSPDELIEFFANSYVPTPIVAPWNGGSGFHPKDSKEAIESIRTSDLPRYRSYRNVIELCNHTLLDMGLTSKPDDRKEELLLALRNRLPDLALSWLDSAFVITREGPKYPPLLGTGGNDGRLDFTNNHMQRLCGLIPPDGTAAANSEPALREALFGEVHRSRIRAAVGQFDPGSAGGVNLGSGFDGAALVNPWDYVLMLEGAICFAAASVKRLEKDEPGVLAYPFCVQTSGIGYASAATADEDASRSEIWVPLWTRPVTFREIKSTLSEGRVEVHGRRARNGVDFARAIAALGVDRGITSFERYGFQQRNGLAYLAVPLGHFEVRAAPEAEELLGEIDEWLERFQRAAGAKNAPASADRALRGIHRAIMELCRTGKGPAVEELLIALGEAEVVLARSRALREKVGPVPLLSESWIQNCGLPSLEFRLAAAIASIDGKSVGPIRRHLEPINVESLRRWPTWAESDSDPGIVWSESDLTSNLLAVLHRRIIEAPEQEGKQNGAFPVIGQVRTSLGDVAAFIHGDTDDRRIDALMRGLTLIDWPRVSARVLSPLHGPDGPPPAADFALVKLCHLACPIPSGFGPERVAIPLVPEISAQATRGAREAISLAARRLSASGFQPIFDVAAVAPLRVKRIAAALLLPLWHKEGAKSSPILTLCQMALRPAELDEESTAGESTTTSDDEVAPVRELNTAP